MKKIILTLLTFIIIFLITFLNKDEKLSYLSIGDHLSYGINNFNNINSNYNIDIQNKYKNSLKSYINYSQLDDYRVNDLINDINYNKKIVYNNKEYNLQNLLVKSNLIIISIGMNDIIYKNNSNEYIDELITDIENLFILLRKYNKDKILFLGFYNVINNSKLIDNLNNKLLIKCNKYEIDYIDISKLDNYIFNNIYPNTDGYKYITNNIFTKL